MTDRGAPLAIETEAGVRTIRLDRPPRNLLVPSFMAAIGSALRSADEDPTVHGAVLTGSGEAFCGGLDIAALQGGGDPVDFATHLAELLKLLPTLGIPVVAAVNGDTPASGASLVCACDYAVTVPEARIGTYEVSAGLWPMVAQVPLIKRLGPRAAMENVGSGEPFTSERARQLGVVQDVVDAHDLEIRARRWLELSARGGDAVRAGRPLFYRLAEMSYEDALDASLAEFTAMF
jgi:enoyl-CoA hydratase/carnithine racemase